MSTEVVQEQRKPGHSSSTHKHIKRFVGLDKRRYIDDLAKQAQEAAMQGNMRELYETTKTLAGKYKQSSKPVRDKGGKILTKKEDQLKRWAEHFEDLLNRPAPGAIADIPPAENQLLVNCNTSTEEEVRRAIHTLKNGKAAGPDDVPAEALKAAPYTSAAMVWKIIQRIWKQEKVPQDWKEGFQVKLPKKGDQSECENQRGIMLLSVPGNVFNRIMLERLKTAVDKKLRDHQAGFRKERSCIDQKTTLRIIIEQSLEWNASLYVTFVGFEKAFDSLDRKALWKFNAALWNT